MPTQRFISAGHYAIFSTSVVTVDHILCDCFSFKEGFSSCCHINAACRFGT